MRTLKVKELTLDQAIYPRFEVDKDHVFNMVEALKAGVKLPAIIIDKDTLKIVDGVHRWSAIKEYEGENGEVECIEKEYTDSREFFLDSIKYNNNHGRNLTRVDRARIVEIGSTLGVDERLLATSMQVSEQFVGVLKSGSAHGQLTTTNVTPPARDRVRKWDVPGEESQREYEPNGGGFTAEISRINRVRDIIGRLDWDDDDIADNEGLRSAVIELRDLLNEKFPAEVEASTV